MKNTKRKHLKLCLLLLFMVLGCFAITNVRTTTVQASSRTFKSNGRTYMEKQNDNTLNTVLYQKVSGRYKQVAKSSRYLIYRFSYGKKLYFSSADDEELYDREPFTVEVGNTEDIDKIADILRELGDHYLEEDVASIPLSLTAYMKVTSFNPVVYEVCYMDKERQQRTVEEEKLRKEAVQELLIYQG